MLRSRSQLRFAFVLACGTWFAQAASGALVQTSSQQPPMPQSRGQAQAAPSEANQQPRQRQQRGEQQQLRRQAPPPTMDPAIEQAQQGPPPRNQGDAPRAGKGSKGPGKDAGGNAGNDRQHRAKRIAKALKLRQHMLKRGAGGGGGLDRQRLQHATPRMREHMQGNRFEGRGRPHMRGLPDQQGPGQRPGMRGQRGGQIEQRPGMGGGSRRGHAGPPAAQRGFMQRGPVERALILKRLNELRQPRGDDARQPRRAPQRQRPL